MEAALARGAGMVNDVSALTHDDRAAEVAARAGCPVVLMHSPGSPADDAGRADATRTCCSTSTTGSKRAIEAAVSGGHRARQDHRRSRHRLRQDRSRHNLELLNGLSLFHGLGAPVLLGASRKRLIGALANEAPAGERLGGSVALATMALAQGVQLLRVHDVAETVQALKVWRGLRDAALSPISA